MPKRKAPHADPHSQVRAMLSRLQNHDYLAAIIQKLVAMSPIERELAAMPPILDKAVSKIRASGVKPSSAYPIAVASLQKAGDLKKGSLAATAKGTARGKMTAKQRAATR